MNVTETVNTDQDIAQQWYIPGEVLALRRWLVWAILINLIIVGGESLRDNPLAQRLHILGIVALIICRLVLSKASEFPLLKWVCLLFSLAALAAGFYSLANSAFMVYDWWSRLWLIVPAGFCFYTLLTPLVSRWTSGISAETAQRGHARNRDLIPMLDNIGAHTLLLHAIALVIIPMVWIIDVSVSPGNVLGGRIGDAFSLEHFQKILQSSEFWVWTKNSVIVSIGTTVTALLLAIPAGYAFSRYSFSGKKASMFAFMLIQMFPGIIILVPYFMVMKTLGLLNTAVGLMIAYSVTALPLGVWMLKGFFDTVPRELEEAAVLDGCNQLQIFWKIVLPLSIPAIAITALFAFLAAWNEFLLALVLNTSNDKFTLPVGLASMIPSAGQRWGDFAAASILVSAPVVVLFMLFQKSLVQGLSAGAVKG